MSGQHTPGRLVVSASGGSLMTEQGAIVMICVLRNYARRLAACWNACIGFETEVLEKADLHESAYAAEGRQFELTQEADTLRDDLRKVEANYEAARALLAEVYEEGNLDIGDQVAKELDNRINAFIGGEKAPARTIPAGWALTSADFSIIANGGRKPGTVTLIRTGEDRANWMKFADADVVPLYAFGLGMNFDEALADAIKLALAAAPVPKGDA